MKHKKYIVFATALVLLIIFVFIASSCGNRESGGVIFGKNNFLFNKAAENYDYISDFRGEIPYSEDELDRIYNALNKRRIAYANNGVDYFAVIIPNSQTVYPEYMPSEYGTLSGNTRLRQLSEYLTEKGNINFIDLTEILTEAKDQGQLYNNTENSLNALGAYYAYTGIYQYLPEKMRTKNKINTELVKQITAEKNRWIIACRTRRFKNKK